MLWCQIALDWLHYVAWALCWGEEARARNLVFFSVKWLQPAMKGTLCVRRLRLGSFGSFYVFCNNVCSWHAAGTAPLEGLPILRCSIYDLRSLGRVANFKNEACANGGIGFDFFEL